MAAPGPGQRPGRAPERQAPLRLERTWVATTEWSDEAGAELALWQCLPSYAWGQTAMPPLYHAVRSGSGWFASQSPVADFGGCVRKLRERAPFEVMLATDANQRYPDTERGRRAAQVLMRKLPALIQQIGCSGTGADECVLLLEALASLGTDRATLMPLLARMAPAFPPPADFAAMVADPAASWGTPRPTGDAVPAWASQTAHDQLLLSWIWLDARVKALAAPAPAGDRLPAGEPAATIGRVLDAALALQHIEQVGGPPAGRGPEQFNDPWSRIARLADARPEWMAALRSRADAAAAAAPGCAPLAGVPLHSYDATSPPPEFWLAFASRKLVKVGTTCGRMPNDLLAQHLAGDADDPILRQLAPLVGREDAARAHIEILSSMEGHCPMTRDLLGLCAWLHDVDLPAAKVGAKSLPLKPGQAWTELPRDNLPAVAGPATLHPELNKAIDGAIARLPDGSRWAMQREWIAPGGAAMAAWVGRSDFPWEDPPGVATHARNLLLLVDARGTRVVNLPEGLEESLSTLSDIDGDGNPELWSEADEGECDGEDLKAGVDCAIHRAWLNGEVFGTELATFLRGPWPAPPGPLPPHPR